MVEATSAAQSTDDRDESTADSLSPAMEDYLRHIYNLEEAGEEWVSNSAVADRLSVERATVTSMFDALGDRGFLEREKYRPVRLTPLGRTAALAVVRKHRLVETFLVEVFDYELSEVDAEADTLEHHLSDRLAREFSNLLGAPELDPHGDPIPDANLDVPAAGERVSVADTDVGTRHVVTRVTSRDDETLAYLVEAGVKPSATLTVDETTPFGMVTVSVESDESTVSLPADVAASVLVESVE
ncbi:metal-dependent transcriptional regulator [Halogeometricum limi]|uniref:Iron (Metal) dependent repressor, DtxR family n=1 Tax=Halogeometricum limi TaxID=555875 RepID=A0A1I6IE93_9EURY|nr:metal-dependent transcriptional regulator [Halogeometricum limi]SFR65075.1 iron (metal) dependent repressor, DtxR family [Halogeometricum limi]